MGVATLLPIIAVLLVAVGTMLLAVAAGSEKTPLLATQGWLNSEAWLKLYPGRSSTFLSDGVIGKADIYTNARRVGDAYPTFAGRIETVPFAPSPHMIVPLQGGIYVGKKSTLRVFDLLNVSVRLECPANGKKIELLTGPSLNWFERPVAVPEAWCSEQVKLVAESRDASLELGVGTPFAVSHAYYLMAGPSGYAAAYAVASLFFLPLVIPFLFFNRLSVLTRTSAALVWFGAVGYLAFVLQARNAPQWVSLLVTLCVLLLPAATVRNFRARYMSDVDVRLPERLAIVWLLVGAAVTVPFFVTPIASGIWTPNFMFHPTSWATDNHLSVNIATHVIETDQVVYPGILPYSVVDRGFIPPGLAAIVLATLNLMPLGAESPIRYLPAQMLMMLANAIVLFLLCAFGHVAALRLQDFAKLVLLCLTTPFFFFNMVFTWPKLAAATFAVWAVLLLRHALVSGDRLAAVFVAPVFALGVMFHISAALVAPGIGLYTLYVIAWKRRMPNWGGRDLALIAASFVVALALFAYHNSFAERSSLGLAVIFTGANVNIPKGEVISYLVAFASKLTPASYLSAKLDQIGLLLWPALSGFPAHFSNEPGILAELRRAQFFSPIPSLAVLPVIVLLGYRYFFRSASHLTDGLLVSLVTNVLAMAILFPFVFMAFVTFHLPYSLPLSALLLAALSIDYRSRVIDALLALHVVVFVATWIVDPWWMWVHLTP